MLFFFCRFGSICRPVITGVVAVQIVAVPTGSWRPTMTAVTSVTVDRQRPVAAWFIQPNTRAASWVFRDVLVFFAYKKLLGRTEMRIRESMDRQSIRSV